MRWHIPVIRQAVETERLEEVHGHLAGKTQLNRKDQKVPASAGWKKELTP